MKKLADTLLFGLCIGLFSCTSESSPALTIDGAAPPADTVSADLSDSQPAETLVPDEVGPDIKSDIDDMIDELDLEVSCQPGSGCFLDPCSDPKDCQSGLCVEHLGNTVCTVTCVEECPEGWECAQIGAGPDAMFACLSPFSHLCRPCDTKLDCTSPTTGIENVCLTFGEDGNFCGSDCSGNGNCPLGFTCAQATTTNGATLLQCLPDNGLCVCTEKSVELGLSTTCYTENEFGICTGQRLCTEEGLTACDAPDPEEETCDGVDNDCDGEIDNIDCHDDNECTEDLCNPDEGCQHAPLTGTSCDDGDVCTLADHCDAGACTGTAINCEDDNICTTDTCDPAGGCLYAFNSLTCDDSDPCTINDNCEQGSCSGVAVSCDCTEDADCLVLEDDDDCNGTLFCNQDVFPYECAVDEDTIIDCPDPEGLGAECLKASCNPDNGECSFITTAEGKVCDDGNICSIGEHCTEGLCTDSVELNCNDGNPCTDDSCTTDNGCTHEPNQASCEDGNLCTVKDICEAGTCLPGTSLSCDDGNLCTDDSCNPDTGCEHAANNFACDDKNACTMNDVCGDGTCAGPDAVDCNDNNPCTTDACEPATGCQSDNNAAPCDDQDGCTTEDICNNGACTGGPVLDCDDDNPCTDDACKEGSCLHVANSEACDDANPCTTVDFCADKFCKGTVPLTCNDDNVCTTDTCDPASDCVYTPNSHPCDDGNACTTMDTCAESTCAGGPAPDCNDNNVCTDDDCSADTGCIHTANLELCDDGNLCTEIDHCGDNWCQPGEPIDCDDNNPCTNDWCHPITGCQHTPNTYSCDDGDACTILDTCAESKCTAGPALNCNDGNVCTDDDCQPDTGCVYANNGADCDDGNACTMDEICGAGKCQVGNPIDCNDSNICTDDTCNPLTGCVYDNNSVPCNDLDVCTLGDICSGGLCAGPDNLDCDDSNDCTTDSCDGQSGCSNEPIIPCCGDGSIHGEEVCDNGDDNDAGGLGACSETCTLDSKYVHVLRMNSSGAVLAGDWDDARKRVIEQGQNCLVRFDSRVAHAQHIEYSNAFIRFDFQPLHAVHDTWDSYAYVEFKLNSRAGIGAAYRRGHANNIWQKDHTQHGEAYWTAATLDLYCERETRYEHITSFASNGTVTNGQTFDQLYSLVVEQGAECKVRYDSRISAVPHVEYTTDLLYLDFLGLHAFHNVWDSYAYIVLHKNVRASLAAAYRKGNFDTVWKKDRAQHGQAYSQNLAVDVFCTVPDSEKYSINSNGQFLEGSWDGLYGRMVTEARDCRVRFDHRIADIPYLEYSDNTLLLETENLHAPHNTWEAMAQIFIQHNSTAALRATYRKGHGNGVYLKSAQQHAYSHNQPQTVEIFCDMTEAREPVYSVSTAGNDLSGDWESFYSPLTDNDEAYDCIIRVDGRITQPLAFEYGGTNAEMYFDYVSYAGYHDSWDAYAGAYLQHGIKAGLLSSYRRGHASHVWKKDRAQHAVYATVPNELEFLCW
jgi:hypothetical protein